MTNSGERSRPLYSFNGLASPLWHVGFCTCEKLPDHQPTALIANAIKPATQRQTCLDEQHCQRGTVLHASERHHQPGVRQLNPYSVATVRRRACETRPAGLYAIVKPKLLDTLRDNQHLVTDSPRSLHLGRGTPIARFQPNRRGLFQLHRVLARRCFH